MSSNNNKGIKAKYILQTTTSQIMSLDSSYINVNQTDTVRNGIVVIPWVSDIRIEPQIPAVITLTLDSYVVEHRKPYRIGEIVLSGDVGPILYEIKEDNENISIKAFKTLKDRIENNFSGGDVLAYSPYILHLIDEGLCYEVVPTRLNFIRGTRNKLALRYELAFKIVGISERKIEINVPSTIAPAAKTISKEIVKAQEAIKEKSFIEKAIDFIYDGIGYIDKATEFINGINDKISRVIIGTSFIIYDIISSIDSLRNAVYNLIMTPAVAENYIRSLINHTNQLIDNLKNNINNFRFYYGRLPGMSGLTPASYNPLPEQESKPEEEQSNLEKVSSALSMANELQQILSYFYISFNKTITSLYSPNDKWIVRSGDTVWGIAAEALGNVNRWEEIVTLNNLVYPYISTCGGPNIAKPGDVIKIPSFKTGVVKAISCISDNYEEMLFDKDLKLDSNNSLYLSKEIINDTVDEFDVVDFDFVKGQKCFEQNLNVRINTTKYSNLLFYNRGIDSMVGIAHTIENEAAFILSLQDELNRDDRIAVVKDLNIYVDGNKWEWSCLIVLKNSVELAVKGSAI